MSVEQPSPCNLSSTILGTDPEVYSTLVLFPDTLGRLEGWTKTEGTRLLSRQLDSLVTACRFTHMLHPLDIPVKKVYEAAQDMTPSAKTGFPEIGVQVLSDLPDAIGQIISAVRSYQQGDEDALQAAWRSGHDWWQEKLKGPKADGERRSIEETLEKIKTSGNEAYTGQERRCRMALCRDPPSNHRDLPTDSKQEWGLSVEESLQNALKLQQRCRDFVDASGGAGTPTYYKNWAMESDRAVETFLKWSSSAETDEVATAPASQTTAQASK